MIPGITSAKRAKSIPCATRRSTTHRSSPAVTTHSIHVLAETRQTAVGSELMPVPASSVQVVKLFPSATTLATT